MDATIHVAPILVETAGLDVSAVYARLATRLGGLTTAEATRRLAEHAANVLARDHRPGAGTLLWHAVINPLVILLAVLATVSFATGDSRAATVMLLMIALSVGLKLYQEAKAGGAAAKLKAMISVCATVRRDGKPQELAVAALVPGDVVELAAGDTATPVIAAHSASLFQTGWFVESLLTQTLVIHIIRTNKLPFLQSRASLPVIAMGLVTVAVGILLPITPIGGYLGFTRLLWLYWPLLLATLACHLVVT